MQWIVKNTTNPEHRTILVPCMDIEGTPVDCETASFNMGGASIAEAPLDGDETVEKQDGSTHKVIISQDDSNLHDANTNGYLELPSGVTGNPVRVTVPFFVYEAAPDAPPTLSEVADATNDEAEARLPGTVLTVLTSTTGTLLYNGVTYPVVLDEDNGRILEINAPA